MLGHGPVFYGCSYHFAHFVQLVGCLKFLSMILVLIQCLNFAKFKIELIDKPIVMQMSEVLSDIGCFRI